ncbi:MAG TPA: tRNA (N6-threonylcarbamoyladenosine(37)-N6)-methyltransferase TrmO [Bacteroidota bacterium]|nr:tRNA (N6-threonylcarbamoyladenosine(37)-N6)-methyltransferase TrmO [Bacteroidota bacterium]
MEEINFIVKPIGVIHTPFKTKYGAPRQPASADTTSIGVITLNESQNFEQALEDIQGFEYIWVLFWFHQNKNWKPKVLPPNSGRTKRGVFATRSPHRPNAIGLSLCKLLEVKGRTLRIENPDMLDGTPIFDLKPYIPHVEAFPQARAGWIAAINEQSVPPFSVIFSADVKSRLKQMPPEERNEIMTYVKGILARDPHPHSYRRIKILKDGTSALAAKRWRFQFKIDGTTVRVFQCTYVNDKQ